MKADINNTNDTNTPTDTPEAAGTLAVKPWKTRRKGDISIFDSKIIRAAIPESFKKLDPRVQIKNPVMFVVEVGSAIPTIEFVRLLLRSQQQRSHAVN